MRGINQRLAELTATGQGLGIEVARVDVQSSLPGPAVNAFNAVFTASQLADKAVADARTEAEKADQSANEQADRTLQVAHAQACERLAKASADTAAVLSWPRRNSRALTRKCCCVFIANGWRRFSRRPAR